MTPKQKAKDLAGIYQLATMSKEAKEYFKKEWGTGFIGATISTKKGLLGLSMDDIYQTMQSYADQKVKKALSEAKRKQKVLKKLNNTKPRPNIKRKDTLPTPPPPRTIKGATENDK